LRTVASCRGAAKETVLRFGLRSSRLKIPRADVLVGFSRFAGVNGKFRSGARIAVALVVVSGEAVPKGLNGAKLRNVWEVYCPKPKGVLRIDCALQEEISMGRGRSLARRSRK